MNLPFDSLAPMETGMRLHLERMPSDTRIEFRRITDRNELGRLFTSCRATARRVERPISHPFARPLRIHGVAARMDEYSNSNRGRFLALVDYFKNSTDPIALRLPAYRLADGDALLLDGNHRATALWMSGEPIDVTLAMLCGPIDRRMLIDLKYWDGGWRRFLNRIRWETTSDRARQATHSS